MTKQDADRGAAYVQPRVVTMDAVEVIEKMGPALAGGSTNVTDNFKPNQDVCGFPMGYPCRD